MDNSADYMLQFFNCETREEGFNDNISTSFLHMHETEACLKDLIRMQIKHLDTAETLMPGIWEKLWSSFAIEQAGGALVNFSMNPKRAVILSSAQRQALETIADKSAAANPLRISAGSENSIEGFLNATVEALKADDSLPQDLKLYIMRLVYDAKRNLDEYHIGNDFELTLSMQKLCGTLYVAETQTKKPTTWEQIKNIAAPMLTALVTGGIEQLGGTAFTTLLPS